MKVYSKENKNKKKDYDKIYRKENKDKKIALDKDYRVRNRDILNQKDRAYYEKNKKGKRRDYLNKNKEKIKRHYKDNPLQYFARHSLQRIEKAIGKDRKNRAEIELCYTQKEFISHIEKQFLKGMGWNNRKEWHIDHKKPISAFIKEGVTDLKVINALSNLQPLWAFDNLSKGIKIQ